MQAREATDKLSHVNLLQANTASQFIIQNFRSPNCIPIPLLFLLWKTNKEQQN